MDSLSSTFDGEIVQHEDINVGGFVSLENDSCVEDSFSVIDCESESVILSSTANTEGYHLLLPDNSDVDLHGLGSGNGVSLNHSSNAVNSPSPESVNEDSSEILQIDDDDALSEALGPSELTILPFTLAKDTHLVQLTQDGQVNLLPKNTISKDVSPLQYSSENIESVELSDGTLALISTDRNVYDSGEDTIIPMLGTDKDDFVYAETDGLNIADINGTVNSDLEVSSFLDSKVTGTFSLAESLLQNKRVFLSGTKILFPCPHNGCTKTFATAKQIKVHERTHSTERPFACEFQDCTKAFATKYALLNHVRVHTGEKPYRCSHDDCPKAFKTSGDLQKHIRIHTGERPFHCPYEGCEKSFTTSNIRKVHIRVHTGERPYICPTEGCGKTFSSATNYKNHVRIHTGERPYLCSFAGCGKRFTEYSSLYKHQVVHTQAKPYECEHCNKTYRQASTLATHKRLVHDDPSEIEQLFVAVRSSHYDGLHTVLQATTHEAELEIDDTCSKENFEDVNTSFDASAFGDDVSTPAEVYFITDSDQMFSVNGDHSHCLESHNENEGSLCFLDTVKSESCT